MYQNKIMLSPRDILQKEFKIDTRGYRLKEVDQFLDTIISDYEQFLSIISNLEKEKADLIVAEAKNDAKLINEKKTSDAHKKAEEIIITAENSAKLKAHEITISAHSKQNLVNDEIYRIIF